MEKMTGLNPIIDLSGGFTGAMLSSDIVRIPIHGPRKTFKEIPVRIVDYAKEHEYSISSIDFPLYYKKTVSFVDKYFVIFSCSFLRCIGNASLILSDYLYDYSLKREYRSMNQFEQKYTKADLVIMAEELPKDVRLTYPAIKAAKGYRHLSKRHIYAIIDIKKIDIKDKVNMYKQVFSS